MSIIVDENSRVVVQGITGNEGLFHTQQMVQYGTKMVAGVTPGKGGQRVEGIPVFNTVAMAVRETARSQGMHMLTEDGWRLIREGVTTVDEVLRVSKDQSHNGVEASA